MAGKDDPRDQDPYPTTDWGSWDDQNPFASTDFTKPVDLHPGDWW